MRLVHPRRGGVDRAHNAPEGIRWQGPSPAAKPAPVGAPISKPGLHQQIGFFMSYEVMDAVNGMPTASIGCVAHSILCRLARFASDSGDCNPSLRRLAEDSGIHPRNVIRAIRKLEDAGLLARSDDHRVSPETGAFRQTSNRYRIDLDRVQQLNADHEIRRQASRANRPAPPLSRRLQKPPISKVGGVAKTPSLGVAKTPSPRVAKTPHHEAVSMKQSEEATRPASGRSFGSNPKPPRKTQPHQSPVRTVRWTHGLAPLPRGWHPARQTATSYPDEP